MTWKSVDDMLDTNTPQPFEFSNQIIINIIIAKEMDAICFGINAKNAIGISWNTINVAI